jgi:hypothetical protein
MASSRSLFLSDICDAAEVEMHADVVCILGDSPEDEGFYWSEPRGGVDRYALNVLRSRVGVTGRVGMELCRDALRFNAVPSIATKDGFEEEREILAFLRHRDLQSSFQDSGGDDLLDWPEAMSGSIEAPRAIAHDAVMEPEGG